MRQKRYFVFGGKLFIGLGISSLALSIGIALIGNTMPLPWEASFAIGIGTFIFIVMVCFGGILIWFDTSWITPRHRDLAPYTPDPNSVARVVNSTISEKEFFVYGKPNEKVRDVVEEEWPFPDDMKDETWLVLDSNDNDVSEKLYSEVEGTLRVIFP